MWYNIILEEKEIIFASNFNIRIKKRNLVDEIKLIIKM